MENGTRVLIYQEDSVTKTHNSGLKDRGRDRKCVVLHSTGGNPDRDPVCIIEKYLGLCPPMYEKCNFYLQSLEKPNPAQWYGYQVLGEKKIGRIIPDLMESAGFKGYYTGHSLRRTGTTRLSNAGVAKKVMKECTGHVSDAIDKYMVTSDSEREKISEILSVDPIRTLSQVQQNVSKIREETVKSVDETIRKAKASIPCTEKVVNIDES